MQSRFSEFPPIFKNAEIKLEDIGEHMKSFCHKIGRKIGVNRSLIISMHAQGILLLTPLLKKYLQIGLVVTRIELVISDNGKAVFDWFVEEECNDRRRADQGGAEFKMKGEASKLKGNCEYARVLMDKYTRLSFAKAENQRKVVHDLPMQIGMTIYSYAKLRMLELWEFINTFLVNDMYQFMEMDTDSLYIAFARDTIDECGKPDLRDQWNTEKWKWFCYEDTTSSIEFDEQIVTFKQWDKRIPCKFKLEYDGDDMSCLNSKVNIIWGETDEKGEPKPKTSCKNTQQKRNELLKQHFLNVLNRTENHSVENAGFIRRSRSWSGEGSQPPPPPPLKTRSP